MKRLNFAYRGKNKSTDVLSFSLLEGVNKCLCESLGDLVISLPTARVQAKEYGVSLEEELTRLCIHGILHLHGYDHERVSVQRRRAMQQMEDRLMKLVCTSP